MNGIMEKNIHFQKKIFKIDEEKSSDVKMTPLYVNSAITKS